MGTWVRTVQAQLPWASANSLITSVPRGTTLVRVRFGWGFWLDAPTGQDMILIGNNIMILGVVTTVGNGTETVPDARLNAGDQAPPTQRWLYWEGRAPVLQGYSSRDTMMAYRDSRPQEAVDIKAMVSAKAIPAGDTLNLWASWNPGNVYSGNTANAYVWYWASVLYQ